MAGITRDAKTVLSEQKANTSTKAEVLQEMVRHAGAMKKILEDGSPLENFGQHLHEAWILKKSLASNVSTAQIDQWYETAREAGATGGKILGAGSGGFLMLFCKPEKQKRVLDALKDMRVFDARFEPQGSKIIFMGE